MKTVKDIKENQRNFKNEILLYLRNDLNESKDELQSIDTDDKYIMSQKKKLQNKFKKANSKFRKSFDQLFYTHPQRNKENYVWWDEMEQKALILKYEKRK